MASTQEHIRELIPKLSSLTPSQLDYIDQIATQLNRDYLNLTRNPNSDFVSPCLTDVFGDALRIHHCFSKEALSKDRFEHALERAVNLCGGFAELASRGNPGHDITINGEHYSMKTEAAREIRENQIHISKFMELGKGDWDFDLFETTFL